MAPASMTLEFSLVVGMILLGFGVKACERETASADVRARSATACAVGELVMLATVEPIDLWSKLSNCRSMH